MFRRLRVVLFLVAILATGAVSASPAFALSRGATRNVQEKLILLGNDIGAIDGVFGKKTREAVRQFQEDAGLKVDGIVGKQTLSALDGFTLKDGGASRPTSTNIQLDIYEDTLTDRLMEGRAPLASRFAEVALERSGTGRYALSINGQTVATSPMGTRVPRISRTFVLPGEDVYLVATASGNRACPLEHVVFAVRANGSFMKPTPIGNCDDVLNARAQDDALVVSFPPKAVPSWRLEETWIYRYGEVTKK